MVENNNGRAMSRLENSYVLLSQTFSHPLQVIYLGCRRTRDESLPHEKLGKQSSLTCENFKRKTFIRYDFCARLLCARCGNFDHFKKMRFPAYGDSRLIGLGRE